MARARRALVGAGSARGDRDACRKPKRSLHSDSSFNRRSSPRPMRRGARVLKALLWNANRVESSLAIFGHGRRNAGSAEELAKTPVPLGPRRHVLVPHRVHERQEQHVIAVTEEAK